MRYMVASLLASLFFLIACDSETPPTTATVTAPVTTTTVPPESVSVAHSLTAGDTLPYEVELRRSVVLGTEGDPEAPLDDLPASAELTLTAAGIVEFEVEESAEAGYVLVVTDSLELVSMEGRVEDEVLEDPGDLDVLGDVVSLPAEISVDSTGLLIETGTGEGLGVLPDPLTVWTGWLGPVLPESEMREGEEWSRRVGSETVASGRLIATGEGGGSATIRGESSASATEVDMSAFYRDFLASFGTVDSDVVPRLVWEVDPGEERWEAVFDPEQGRLLEGSASTRTLTRVEGVVPERVSGEAASFTVRVEVEDELESRFAAPSG